MAEIKSTLELAMERTRHLAMSEEEKAQQKQTDFRKRLQGLLQQYEDQTVTLDAFKGRLDALQQQLKVTDTGIVVSAILQRVDPARDNQHWLALLALLAPPTCAHLEQALTAYREAEAEIRQKGAASMVDRLARDYGISGSAMVPNLTQDTDFQTDLARLRQDYQNNIGGININ